MKRDPALVPLSREHNTALVFALRVTREAPGADDTTVATLYNDLLSLWARGLLPHFRTENECLLARLVRHIPEDDELVQRTNRDHLNIEALVAGMQDNHDPAFRRDRLLDLANQLRTHIRWEEETLFEQTQARLTETELTRLGEEIRDRVGEGLNCATDVARHSRPTS